MERRISNGKVKLTGTPIRRQGSMRKVLNSSRGSDSMLCVSAKPLERSEPKNHSAEAYHNFFQEYSLISEFDLVGKHLRPGLLVIPAAYSKFLWFGVIFVSSGVYNGGMFRFTVHLSKGFPDSKCPRVLFESQIFHPNIDEDLMELDLSLRFPEWRKEENRVWQVLEYLHETLYSPDINFFVNTKAIDMYLNENEEFLKEVDKCVKASQNSILDTPSNDDPHYIKFDKYSSEVHGNARRFLTTPNDERELLETKRGFSWIKKGTIRPFSKNI